MADDNKRKDDGENDPKAWEHQLSRHIAFLDQWRTELSPVDTKIALATEGATSFALTGLRSGYFLNGGALIALPAFIEIFNKLKLGEGDLIAFAAIPFVIGLITSAVANLMAYQCLNTASTANEYLRNLKALEVKEQYYPSKERIVTAKNVKVMKDKSDELFVEAGKGAEKAKNFWIASLVLFGIGAVYSLLMWIGVKRIFVMEEKDFIIKLVEVLAWPAAAVLIVFILRRLILTLLMKSRSGKGNGNGGPEPTPSGQVDPGGPSAEEQLSTTQADPVPAVQNLVGIYQKQLDEVANTLGIDRETALFRALARSNLREHFERSYRVIWGSQIRALQNLNSVAKADVESIKSFYEKAAANYPAMYEEYSFDGWLRFLEGQSLVIRKDDVVQITMEGQEFLKYLVDMRLNTEKAL